MLDQYGRKIDYMRISVTERCNLRCRYCMPEAGIEKQGCKDMLSYEEILRLCRIFVGLGIRKIKITGGEPLVRVGVCGLIRKIKQIPGIEQVTLTTNGVLLAELAEDLIAAGIDGINISLDTVNEDKFKEITRHSGLKRVLAGIQCLLAKNYHNIKINCVPLAEINGDQIADIAAFAKDQPIAVRFIELMPVGCGTDYTAISQEQVRHILESTYGKLQPYDGQLGNGPAEYYVLPHFQGKIGFINAISHKFCNSCNRIRLTANGFLKLCLQYSLGVDLKSLLRSPMSDAALQKLIEKHIYEKPQEHHFHDESVAALRDVRKMFQVGG